MAALSQDVDISEAEICLMKFESQILPVGLIITVVGRERNNQAGVISPHRNRLVLRECSGSPGHCRLLQRPEPGDSAGWESPRVSLARGDEDNPMVAPQCALPCFLLRLTCPISS